MLRVKDIKEKLVGIGRGTGIQFSRFIKTSNGRILSDQTARRVIMENDPVWELKDGGYVIVTSKTKVIRIEE